LHLIKETFTSITKFMYLRIVEFHFSRSCNQILFYKFLEMI
jgi:hypothetical protein